MSLAPRGVVVRLAVGPESTRPFSARPLSLREAADSARVAELVRVLRERHGRPSAEVDAAIAAQLTG